MTSLPIRKLFALLLLAAVAGCGGSSNDDVLSPSDPPPGSQPPPGSEPPPGSDPPPGSEPPGEDPPGEEPPPGTEPPPADDTSMTMRCVDGADYQCSGGTILRTDNGIALTRSGVQAYGISTSDLSANNEDMTGAHGYRPASGGTAEIRIAKEDAGTVSSLNLLLRNLGLSWDGTNERPPIIETFNPTQGRVVLDSAGRLTFVSLPPSSDLGFYDFVTLGPNGTQAHYANNRYFPRDEPVRCEGATCPSIETEGVSHNPGDWRTGGRRPDWASAGRYHGDGDVHAGDGPPDANGDPTWLEGGNGVGVPFPGSKGYRSLANWGLDYANLATWSTQDTVLIQEWARLGNEHNKMRRGVMAFGDVTAPDQVPTGGTASYAGIAYGWYTPDSSTNPVVYWGTATASANFATGEVTVTITDTTTYDEAGTPVPAALTATMTMGARVQNAANYMTGSASSGGMSGGASARFFGPMQSGTSGPPEISGVTSLAAPGGGSAVIGGFIGRRQ